MSANYQRIIYFINIETTVAPGSSLGQALCVLQALCVFWEQGSAKTQMEISSWIFSIDWQYRFDSTSLADMTGIAMFIHDAVRRAVPLVKT